jgi:hypothetical protein
MPNHDVDQTERVRQHVRRIIDQLARHQLKRSLGNNPSLGPGIALRTRGSSSLGHSLIPKPDRPSPSILSRVPRPDACAKTTRGIVSKRLDLQVRAVPRLEESLTYAKARVVGTRRTGLLLT